MDIESLKKITPTMLDPSICHLLIAWKEAVDMEEVNSPEGFDCFNAIRDALDTYIHRINMRLGNEVPENLNPV